MTQQTETPFIDILNPVPTELVYRDQITDQVVTEEIYLSTKECLIPGLFAYSKDQGKSLTFIQASCIMKITIPKP